MRFIETYIAGAWLVQPEPRVDDRGFFARLWAINEFAGRGLNARFVECNNSFSLVRGTLRGLHYQAAPHAEAKLVHCVRGRVFDAIVDMREDSPSHRRWFGAELSAANHSMMYVPEGCAHGYLTLEDASEVIYAVTAPYHPAAERGVRWNDPAAGIVWPLEPSAVSEKDRQWPDLPLDFARGKT